MWLVSYLTRASSFSSFVHSKCIYNVLIYNIGTYHVVEGVYAAAPRSPKVGPCVSDQFFFSEAINTRSAGRLVYSTPTVRIILLLSYYYNARYNIGSDVPG